MPVNEIGLLTPSVGYKPFRYPWAYELWKRQQRVHWMPEEVTEIGDDIEHWENKLTPNERSLLTHLFRFFTQSDIEVQDNYMEKLSRVFKPNEIKMMLAANANMETVHVDAYSLVLETVGMPEAEYSAFLEYEEMKAKHNFLQGFEIDPADPESVLVNLAVFGGFTEGLQLFGMFAMLLNFPRFGLMRGMGKIVSWSVRDESLHCEGIVKLYHAFAQETGALTDAVRNRIRTICQQVVEMEERFVDLAFSLGEVRGMTAEEIKSYVRYLADWRLKQLGLAPLYNIEKHPLPWIVPLINGVEHSNFFEGSATEYSKGATTGTWSATWELFDGVDKEKIGS